MIIVDRVEGEYAVCETDSGMKNIRVKLIKGKVRDGVVLAEKGGIYYVDEDATKIRTDDMRDEAKGIWDS
jgi:hypothetical protein